MIVPAVCLLVGLHELSIPVIASDTTLVQDGAHAMDGITMTIVPSASSYSSNQDPQLTLTLTNAGNVARSAQMANFAYFDFPLIVLDSSGNLVRPHLPPGASGSGGPVYFPPGRTINVTYALSSFGYKLKSGMYTIALAARPKATFQLTILPPS
jgi:hypothetical protein